MRLYYKKNETKLCTIIDVDFGEETIKIQNFTDDLLDRAFGINENPTMKDFERFIEDRSIPRTRANFKSEMEYRGIFDPSPLGIVRFFKGKVEGDPFSIEFEESDIDV